MEQTLKIPKFKTEGDEARWWAENQGELAHLFERAAAAGKLGRGSVARRGITPTTTIRLDPEDIAKARLHAERKGIKYQTYLKMLIHQALCQEDIQSASSRPHNGKSVSRASEHPGLHARSGNRDEKVRKKRPR